MVPRRARLPVPWGRGHDHVSTRTAWAEHAVAQIREQPPSLKQIRCPRKPGSAPPLRASKRSRPVKNPARKSCVIIRSPRRWPSARGPVSSKRPFTASSSRSFARRTSESSRSFSVDESSCAQAEASSLIVSHSLVRNNTDTKVPFTGWFKTNNFRG